MSDESLLKRWDITEEELTQVVDQNPSLRGMLFGYAAEVKLRQYIARNSPVTSMNKDDDHDRRKKGDLRVRTRGASSSSRRSLCKPAQSEGKATHLSEGLNATRATGGR